MRQETLTAHPDPAPRDETGGPATRSAIITTIPQPPRPVLMGRPRSVVGDEAYLRSYLTQAAIDIAAGR